MPAKRHNAGRGPRVARHGEAVNVDDSVPGPKSGRHATAGNGELRTSQQQFQSVLANIPGVVYRCECGEPWMQHFMSDYIKVLTGYPASDFTTSGLRSFGSIIHPADAERVRQAVADAVSTGVPYSIDYRVMHADGSSRWIADHGRVVSDSSGHPLWIDGIFLDLSRQKEAEDNRDRAEEQLRY